LDSFSFGKYCLLNLLPYSDIQYALSVLLFTAAKTESFLRKKLSVLEMRL
jgi:hypothetical protein